MNLTMKYLNMDTSALNMDTSSTAPALPQSAAQPAALAQNRRLSPQAEALPACAPQSLFPSIRGGKLRHKWSHIPQAMQYRPVAVEGPQSMQVSAFQTV